MQTKAMRLTRRKFVKLSGALAGTVILQGCDRTKSEKHNEEKASTSRNDATGQLPPATQPYINVAVWPAVQPVKQPSDSTCWAAVWTMMRSWKEGKQLSVEEAVSRLGPEWVNHFRKNEGLEAQTFTEEGFLKAAELHAKPPADYLSSVYVELLASHGPLWINSGDGILNHATLLLSAQTRSDGRIDFRFVDPQEGKFITKSDEQFFIDFEHEARVIVSRNLNWDFRFQIFYW